MWFQYVTLQTGKKKRQSQQQIEEIVTYRSNAAFTTHQHFLQTCTLSSASFCYHTLQMEVTSISSQFLFQSFRSFSVSLPYILTTKNICCPSSICLYLYKYTQLLSAWNTYRIHYQVYPSWQTIFSWKPSKIQRVKFTVMTKKLPIVIEAVYSTLLTNIPNIWNSLPKTVTGSTSFSTLQKRWWNF